MFLPNSVSKGGSSSPGSSFLSLTQKTFRSAMTFLAAGVKENYLTGRGMPRAGKTLGPSKWAQNCFQLIQPYRCGGGVLVVGAVLLGGVVPFGGTVPGAVELAGGMVLGDVVPAFDPAGGNVPGVVVVPGAVLGVVLLPGVLLGAASGVVLGCGVAVPGVGEAVPGVGMAVPGVGVTAPGVVCAP